MSGFRSSHFMRYIADFHVHSKYSRATSKDLSPVGLFNAAIKKGIDIIGTGDFTHPQYLQELKENLVEAHNAEGFFTLKKKQEGKKAPVFVLSQEISCIYSQGERVRRNHILITAPDFATVDRIVAILQKVGNLSADGRPILGIRSDELAKKLIDINDAILIIPAHIWTPWFSLFGSKSGFDSVKECFGDTTPHIFAVETGLSSDPLMNWRISELDKYAIVSNGDAHSAKKVGREATVYELAECSYAHIVTALKNSAKLNKAHLPDDYIASTIEFYPEEGKYHYDGHRDCSVVYSPKETKAQNGLCPQCRKPLTLGVAYRVEELADRSEEKAQEYGKKYRPDFKKIVPLEEIIADVVGQKVGTKRVHAEYETVIEKGGSEFRILLDMSEKELCRITSFDIVEGILRVREGRIHVHPGYDGVFGQVHILDEKERKKLPGAQGAMF